MAGEETGKRRSVKLTRDDLVYVNAFLEATNVVPRDCIACDDAIVFLVDPERIGAAIGKEGRNTQKLSKDFGKNAEILPYADNAEGFVRSALGKIKIGKIDIENGSLAVHLDSTARKLAFQKAARIKRIKKILERNYNIRDFKIR